MREIKFRAPDGVTGQFVYFNLCNLGTANDSFGISLDLDKAEQFTGLRDKTGREIYEGDILTRRVSDYLGNEYSRAGVVQYTRGIFGVNWDYSKSKDPEWSDGGMYGGWGKRHNLRSLDDDLIEALEVIGNIQENPELLA